MSHMPGAEFKPAGYLRPPPPEGPPPTAWGTPVGQPPIYAQPISPAPAKEDVRHAKIKVLMNPYLKGYNNFVSMSDILTLSSKRMPDLPTLQKYCHPTNQSCLCWNSVLGRCFWGRVMQMCSGPHKERGCG